MLFLACLKLPLSLTLATLLPSSAHTLLVDTCLRVKKAKPASGARTVSSYKSKLAAHLISLIGLLNYEIEFPTISAGFLSETNIVWLVSYSLQLFTW